MKTVPSAHTAWNESVVLSVVSMILRSIAMSSLVWAIHSFLQTPALRDRVGKRLY